MSLALYDTIKTVKASLTWPVKNEREDSTPGPLANALSIQTDPVARRHTIYLPNHLDAVPPLDYLHELVHAKLAEKAHPQLSSQYFAADIPQEAIDLVFPASVAAADWFVDEALHTLAAAPLEAQIAEDHAVMQRALSSRTRPIPPLDFLAYALAVAQVERYCLIRTEPRGPLATAVAAFQAVPPDTPSLGAITDLTNRLLRLYAPLAVEAINEDGVDVWVVEYTRARA